MIKKNLLKNLVTLNELLAAAEKGKYAVGSFSPRYTPLIKPILRAGQKNSSPIIVQVSQKELNRYNINPYEFADEFYNQVKDLKITIPVCLHLDHTKSLNVIMDAIEAGFTSVMIDASEKPFNENIKITQKVVEYAHKYGVSVEAELGRIGTTDNIETDSNEEIYTDPKEALEFVNLTHVDALAISCGTAHGVYKVKKPTIDYELLREIKSLTPVHLVLHGGSGVPKEMVQGAYRLPEGGVSKVNIATDLETSFLTAIGRKERLTNKLCKELSQELLQAGQNAVEQTVTTKIKEYLLSDKKAI